MKTVAVLTLFAFSLFHLPSFAQQSRHPQRPRNKSHYEELRHAFNRADRPARFQDFEASNWGRCVYVDVADQYNLRETRVRTVKMHIPSNGPLIPGRTEYRVDLFHDRAIERNPFSYFNSSYEVQNPDYFLQIVDGPGWARMNIYGKMDRNILVFHLSTSSYGGPQAPMRPQAYGYCWNERQGRPDDGSYDGPIEIDPIDEDDEEDRPLPPLPPRPAPPASKPVPPQVPAPQPAPAPPANKPAPAPPVNKPAPPVGQPVPMPAPTPKPVPTPKPTPAPKPTPKPGTPKPPPQTGEPMPLPPPPPAP